MLYGVGVIAMVVFLPEGLVSIGKRWRKLTPEPETTTALIDQTALRVGSLATRPSAAAAEGPPLLVVTGVTQRFGGLAALDGVDVVVQRGTVHAVIGPNGSGKTTFLNVLSGAYTPQAGSAMLDGVELLGRRPSAIAHAGMSRTFQNIRVYKSLSVLENVMVGSACHRRSGVWRIFAGTPSQRGHEWALRETAQQALQFVGLAEFAHRPAGSLAYAQQRLLEIARALATAPKVLLLDEPAAGMNPQEAARLMELIVGMRDAGITIVFVEHNVKLVMGVSDRITVFDFGKKIAEGIPQQIQSNEAVIEAYLGRPRKLPPAPNSPTRSSPCLRCATSRCATATSRHFTVCPSKSGRAR